MLHQSSPAFFSSMSGNTTLVTRKTLLLRLKDPADQKSWLEFTEIYTPLLFRYCLKRDIRKHDAADIIQDVMRSVCLAMQGFEYDPAKGKFKAWLFTALRHAVGRHFRDRAKRPVTAGDSGFLRMIEETPDEKEIRDWDREYQREILAWAMEKVRPEFAERIWTAFEQTAIHGRRAKEVGAEIDMSDNSVNVAKSRVLKRLREKAQSVDAERWEAEMSSLQKKVGKENGKSG